MTKKYEVYGQMHFPSGIPSQWHTFLQLAKHIVTTRPPVLKHMMSLHSWFLSLEDVLNIVNYIVQSTAE